MDNWTDYSILELEKIKIWNEIQYTTRAAEREEAHTIAMKEATMKKLDSELLVIRQRLQPHIVYGPDICYDPNEGKYRCELKAFDFDDDDFDDDFDDEDQRYMGIVVYGDTPAQAFHNFDHTFLHGE